jgi:carbonic anhydrase
MNSRRKANLFLTVLFVFSFSASGYAAAPSVSVPPQEALQRLMDGNKRFVEGKMKHPRQDHQRMEELVKGQHPFAVVLGCSDSRVPPEIVFDQGLGDLFVIRVAGNILTPEGQGSIEYAVDHLGTKLILVLGHEKCGAVKATVEGGKVPGKIGTLTKAIAPAIKTNFCPRGDHKECSNAFFVAEKIRQAKPILSQAVANGDILIVSAIYNLETGEVELLEE